MSEAEYNLDWLVSVDDHVLEPPNVWQDRIPEKYKGVAPHMVRTDEGEFWVYEDNKLPTNGLSAVAGKKKEEFSPEPVTYDEMRPGCYDATARLQDMDQAGIISSLCFPSLPRFCGQLFMEAKDRDLGFLCLQAYNDWMLDEWCATGPAGRLVPLTLIPMWDPELAAKEMERCAAKGSHAFAFSENPAPLGLPTINDPDGHWDPVMTTANDADMVVCMHVGSSSTLPAISPQSPFMANLAWGANRTSGAMLSWLFSSYFQRFPNLKIALSEGEIGWIPFFLERAEQVYDKQRHWAMRGVIFDGHAENTTNEDFDLRQLYRDHVFGCFIDDDHGLHNLDVIGEDNVMIETDYPHSDSTWPNSITHAQECLAHLAPETQVKILRGNAERIYSFAAPIPVAV